MLENITYFLIFGKPLIMYLGILTLSVLIFATTIGIMVHKGIMNLTIDFHRKLAGIGMLLAVIHATLGVLLYF